MSHKKRLMRSKRIKSARKLKLLSKKMTSKLKRKHQENKK